MGGRRKRSGAEVALIALYWLSGLAFLVEPVRWALGGKSRRARAERNLVKARTETERRQAALLEAEAARAGQQAWAENDRRQRENWQAQEAHRLTRPVPCPHCRQLVDQAASKCPNCGAPKEAAV